MIGTVTVGNYPDELGDSTYTVRKAIREDTETERLTDQIAMFKSYNLSWLKIHNEKERERDWVNTFGIGCMRDGRTTIPESQVMQSFYVLYLSATSPTDVVTKIRVENEQGDSANGSYLKTVPSWSIKCDAGTSMPGYCYNMPIIYWTATVLPSSVCPKQRTCGARTGVTNGWLI